MSRAEKIRLVETSTAIAQEEAEALQLNIDVTLQLDEVASVEAEPLRHGARRHPSRRELADLAGKIYDARRTRDRVFGRMLFGEPAWDMLLALYCLPSRGEFLGVTALSYAAETAMTTGLRWQQILIDRELIQRAPPGAPARRQFMCLTRKGRALMDDYLTRLFYCTAPAPQDQGGIEE